MSEDKIRYDILVSEALRSVIRTVLTRVQKRGLPGDHHFYITFDTRAAGTILSKRLKAQYPEDMMIVLQHKFWDLLIYDDRFEVKLSFNMVPERLVIPFSSIKSFYDPSVEFGFSPNPFVPADSIGSTEADSIGSTEDVPQQVPDEAGADEAHEEPAALPRPLLKIEPDMASVGDSEQPIRQEEQPRQESAKVVELNMFRKK